MLNICDHNCLKYVATLRDNYCIQRQGKYIGEKKIKKLISRYRTSFL